MFFLDVYNIEPQSDGLGGISRFVSALRQFADSNPLVLFSGDAFNPSFISAFTKGRHMVERFLQKNIIAHLVRLC